MRNPEHCTGCRDALVPLSQWRKLTPEQRTELRTTGTNVHHGRGLCCRCYTRAKAAGTLHDYQRTTVPVDVVVEEWQRMDHAGATRRQQLETLAPRLGMSPDALERALDRAGIRGESQQPSLYRQLVKGEPEACALCRIRRVDLADAEARRHHAARRQAADSDSAHWRAQVEAAVVDVAEAQAAWDMHLELDHPAVAA